MKIAILSPFYPLRGGIAQFADALANALSVEHEVQCYSFKRQYPDKLFPGTTQWVENAEEGLCVAKPLLDSMNPVSYVRTAKDINRFEPDLYIDVYWMSYMTLSMGSVRSLVRCSKKMTVVHNFIPHEPKFYDARLAKLFLRKSSGLIALSDAVRGELQNCFPTKKIKTLLHPNYVQFGETVNSTEARNKLGLPLEKKIILFFGLIRSYKGLDTLIEAFSKLGEEYFLLMAGECYEEIESYQKQLSKLPESSYQLHNRFIPDKEVSLFFSAANVCVLPYKSATQSGVTAVAHHFHLPVIATKVGGLHEFVDHDKDGYLAAPNDAVDLHKHLEMYFLQEKEETFRMVLKGSKHVSWTEFSSQLISFARSL